MSWSMPSEAEDALTKLRSLTEHVTRREELISVLQSQIDRLQAENKSLKDKVAKRKSPIARLRKKVGL